MKFHYVGKYNGDENSLPQRELKEGVKKFKEPENMEKLANYMNIAGIIVFCSLYILASLRMGAILDNVWGILTGIVCLVPHEFLHASCFKKDVYMYTNLKQRNAFCNWNRRF